MTGRPYTMKEMKGIVEYITENKYYSDIKGRKMWMDYANTPLTNRTWQSLKETFLKRILPDIYNPYYDLSKEQIVSFKQGHDVEAKDRNKLEIQTISDSSSDGQQRNDKQATTTLDINAQDTAVEVNTCSKIPEQNRSSTDTIVLENCYENAEEIQKVLESPSSPNPIDKPENSIIKCKDFITYSEPLPPILQKVINDFASESENSDREPVMEIDLNVPDAHSDDNTNERQETTMNVKNIEDGVTYVANTPENGIIDADNQLVINEDQVCESISTEKMTINISESDDSKKMEVVDRVVATASEDVIEGNKDNADDDCQANVMSNLNPESGNKDDSALMNKKYLSPSCSNTTDSLLPNNPEGFKIKKITQVVTDNEDNVKVNNNNNGLRKRATSEDNLLVENKKRRLLTKVSKTGNKPIKTVGEISKVCVENMLETVEEVMHAVVIESDKPTASSSYIDKRNDNETVIETAQEVKRGGKSPQMGNLCLKSVSLFEEQFNGKKYTDSESSGVYLKTKQMESETEVIDVHTKVSSDNVILLKSNSETESDGADEVNKSGVVSHTHKSQRDDALAKVFGFSTGAVTTKRKPKINQKRSISRHKTINTLDSDSSEWTSETDSEAYVSPPRGRRHRQMRKYLKPKSSRILSFEEEGGLFVMYGKRIYPLVRDGKIVKNYLTYTPDNDSDFIDESFWKLKYEEEKKKSEELVKMLNQNVPKDKASSKQSPNLSRSSKQTADNCPTDAASPAVVNNRNVNKGENERENKREEKIKIKVIRNNEQVHLEGLWPQIHPVLEQVVNIFHTDPTHTSDDPKSKPSLETPVPREIASGKSTPLTVTIDPEVHNKVESMEKEIFQEIEERDKEEQTKPDEQERNVKKRSLRLLRKNSSASVQNDTKKGKQSKKKTPVRPDKSKAEESFQQEANDEDTGNKSNTPANKTYVIQTRTRSKNINASSLELTEKNAKRKRKSSTLKREESKKFNDNDNDHDGDDDNNDDDDESIRYMLPPAQRRSLHRNLNGKSSPKTGASYLKESAGLIITSPDSLSRISESTQGYHESDNSPVQFKQKKKNLSVIVRHNKRYSDQRLSRSQQRNQIINIPYKTSRRSTLTRSNIHNTGQSSNMNCFNSESYQYSYPNRVESSNILLERIDEISAIQNNARLRKSETEFHDEFNTKSHGHDVGSSSSVSLPLSPELSLVENISISKDLVRGANVQRIINDPNSNNDTDKSLHVKYLISEMDITVPLMQQVCAIETDVANDKDGTMNKTNRTAVTESLLKEIRSVKINDNTSDSSIDRKLQDLLLESAKKDITQNMDVDDVKSDAKKSGAKKRCSTPRKKRERKKSKTSQVDVIIEEHTESCSVVGGSSCPPSIQVFDENAMDCEEIITNNKRNMRSKQKKDIIKVKILKPKANRTKRDNSEIIIGSNNRMSLGSDSGINDTDMITLPTNYDNNNVELIHNHSETCLQANECIGDSVEYIDNNNSVISVDSNSVRSVNWNEFLDNEFFLRVDNNWQLDNNNHNNVQNFQLFNNNNQLKSDGNVKIGNEMIHQIPTATEINSSLITEDLSHEIPTQTSQPTKWYLFSEDELSNTNILCPQMSGAGSGANLKQIFPITCAIPDLSDITEASKENDDSKKPSMMMNVVVKNFNTI